MGVTVCGMGRWRGTWVVRRQITICLVLLAVVELNAELDFAVHVKEGGGAEAADRIARKHGMRNMGEVSRDL